MVPNCQLDIIIWGATGYTGALIAEYLARQSKEGGSAAGIKWALAGRNRAKMQDLKDKLLEIEPNLAKVVAIVVADDNTAEVLTPIAASARLVIACVGPYTLYGTPMVAACVKAGVDYVDVTGEGLWHRSVIDQFHREAEQKGVIVIPSCGFDSIPSDLGVLFTAHQLKEKYNAPCTAMTGYFDVRGGASGGTMASVLLIAEQPLSNLAKMASPFLLNDPAATPPRVRWGERDQQLPSYDSALRRWTTKWIMAMYNTRIVRRSVSLLQAGKQTPDVDYFDKDFVYHETMFSPNLIAASVLAFGLLFFSVLMLFAPVRWVLRKFLYTPGQGPPKETRAKNWFRTTFRAVTATQQSVVTSFAGGDGYEATAQMAVETALGILEDKAAILKRRQGRGGVLTAASTVGLRLVDRLRAAGLKIQLES